MARIPEDLRLPMINRHLTHWAEVDDALPNPLRIAGTYGIVALEAQRTEFETLFNAFKLLRDTLLPIKRQQRDAMWGLTPEDPSGVWFKLKGYRPLVKAMLGSRHPLARTIPNFSQATPGNYVLMCRAFLDHWTQVNASLGASPLVLGTFTLAMLQTITTNLETLTREIDADKLMLDIKQEQLEQLFGDEAEDTREPTSIVARLMLYHANVLVHFAGQPLGDSLPDIFPPDTPTALPTFDFNWVMLPNGSVRLWYSEPDPEWNATQVFLKEGADTHLEPINPTRVALWPDITIIDDLDVVEFRDADGLTVARGTHQSNLPQPA